jgi:hypothetical protein
MAAVQQTAAAEAWVQLQYQHLLRLDLAQGRLLVWVAGAEVASEVLAQT